MKDRASLVRGAAALVSTLWAALAFFAGSSIPNVPLKLISYVPTVIGYLLIAFDLWIWRWPGVHRLVGRPKVMGTWKATLQPRGDSLIPVGGNFGPIKAAFVVEQTYWSVHARLTTTESESVTDVATIVKTPDSRDGQELLGQYRNEPRATERPRSTPHRGSVRLCIIGDEPQSLSGSYWTDRLTAGSMDLDLFDRKTTRNRSELLQEVLGT